MTVFDFTLKFALPELEQDAADYIEQLGAAGCDDAMIGVGIKGRIFLQFSREADTAFNAVLSAVEDVEKVFPDIQQTYSVQVLEQLVSSLDKSDTEMDKIWSREAEARINAYERAELDIVPVKKVLRRYKA